MRIRVVAVMILLVATFAGAAPSASADHGTGNIVSTNLFMSNFRFCEVTPQCAWPNEIDHENLLPIDQDEEITIHWMYTDFFCTAFDALPDSPVPTPCAGHQLEPVSANWSTDTTNSGWAEGAPDRDGLSITVKFNEPGTYTYRCAIHGDAFALPTNPDGGMTGQFVVT